MDITGATNNHMYSVMGLAGKLSGVRKFNFYLDEFYPSIVQSMGNFLYTWGINGNMGELGWDLQKSTPAKGCAHQVHILSLQTSSPSLS